MAQYQVHQEENKEDEIDLLKTHIKVAYLQKSDDDMKKIIKLQNRMKEKIIEAYYYIRKYYKNSPFNWKHSSIYICSFLCCLIILVFNVQCYLLEEIDMQGFQIIYNNVNSPIIDDIQFVTYNTTCSKQFGDDVQILLIQYAPLFQYEWPGTQISCNCSHSFSDTVEQPSNITSFFDQYFTIGKSCTQANLSKGCETVYELSQKKFSGWNNDQFGKPFILCAKRNSGVTLMTNKTLCLANSTTVCGSGNYTFCVPKNIGCPITEMGFTNNSQLLTENQQIGNMLDTGNGYYFYYLRQTSSLPIVQLRVSEGDEVCKSQQNNISPNRIDYPLMNVRRENCQEIDEMYTPINQINEEQFYYANRVNYFEKMMPYFQFNSNYTWTLFTKTYIPLSCDIELFIKNAQATKLYSLLKLLFMVTIAYFILFGLLYNIGQTATHNYYIWPFHLSFLFHRRHCKYFWIVLNLTISIGFLVMIAIPLFSTRTKNFQLISDANCFSDSISLSFISSMDEYLSSISTKLGVSIFLAAFQLILAIVNLVKEIKQDLEQDQEGVDQIKFSALPGIYDNNQEWLRVQANNLITDYVKTRETLRKLNN